MSDLHDLYQEMIVDHYKAPRNFRTIQDATCHGEGYNPLCGDKVTVQLKIEDGVVKEVAFEGTGCAISTASASMMTEAIKGKSLEEIERLYAGFHNLITGEAQSAGVDLGKLKAFGGVSEFPVRVKCASLPWHTLRSALHADKKPVSTE